MNFQGATADVPVCLLPRLLVPAGRLFFTKPPTTGMHLGLSFMNLGLSAPQKLFWLWQIRRPFASHRYQPLIVDLDMGDCRCLKDVLADETS